MATAIREDPEKQVLRDFGNQLRQAFLSEGYLHDSSSNESLESFEKTTDDKAVIDFSAHDGVERKYLINVLVSRKGSRADELVGENLQKAGLSYFMVECETRTKEYFGVEFYYSVAGASRGHVPSNMPDTWSRDEVFPLKLRLSKV